MLRLLWYFAAVVALSAVAVVIASGTDRLRKRVASETSALWSGIGGMGDVDREALDSLPVPARAYLTKALGRRRRAVQAVRFRHSGRFRTSLTGPWRKIRGVQYEGANPPGFVWWGRLKLFPGLWVDARDRSQNGTGGMLIVAEALMPVVNRLGPELDQGAMLRLLSDFVLFPTALLDTRHVSWTPIDNSTAQITLTIGECSVSGVFTFGADALPTRFSAYRYFDDGKNLPTLLAWSGEYLDYREVDDGMLVPFRYLGYWHKDGKAVPYVDFILERPEYDKPQPYGAP